MQQSPKKRPIRLASLVFIGFFLVLAMPVSGQSIWLGPKAGIQGSRFFFADTDAQELYREGYGIGWQAGMVANFEIGWGWELATDYAYSRKSHSHTAVFDVDLIQSYRSTHGFIDASALLRYKFGDLPRHYYINIGPVISYWTDGNGRIRTGYTDRVRFDNGLQYHLVWDEEALDNYDEMWVGDANRLQVGIEAGIGMQFDIFYGSRVQLDLRYQLGHTNLAQEADTGIFGLNGLSFADNLKGVHHVLGFSAAFLTSFQFVEIKDKNYLVQ